MNAPFVAFTCQFYLKIRQIRIGAEVLVENFLRVVFRTDIFRGVVLFQIDLFDFGIIEADVLLVGLPKGRAADDIPVVREVIEKFFNVGKDIGT